MTHPILPNVGNRLRMSNPMGSTTRSERCTLVLGGAGKTGRRVAEGSHAVMSPCESVPAAAGRPVEYIRIPHEAFAADIAGAGLPEDIIWLLDYLFGTVLDGRNAWVGNGVQRALSREPRDFSDFARGAARSGVWNAP